MAGALVPRVRDDIARLDSRQLTWVEYTTAVWIPISRQARMIRSAISPRLAIKILENMGRG